MVPTPKETTQKKTYILKPWKIHSVNKHCVDPLSSQASASLFDVGTQSAPAFQTRCQRTAVVANGGSS